MSDKIDGWERTSCGGYRFAEDTARCFATADGKNLGVSCTIDGRGTGFNLPLPVLRALLAEHGLCVVERSLLEEARHEIIVCPQSGRDLVVADRIRDAMRLNAGDPELARRDAQKAGGQ